MRLGRFFSSIPPAFCSSGPFRAGQLVSRMRSKLLLPVPASFSFSRSMVTGIQTKACRAVSETVVHLRGMKEVIAVVFGRRAAA